MEVGEEVAAVADKDEHPVPDDITDLAKCKYHPFILYFRQFILFSF